MKLFRLLNSRYQIFIVVIALSAIVLLQSCATTKPQYGSQVSAPTVTEYFKSDHSIFLIGDAGNVDIAQNKNVLKSLQAKLEQVDKNSTLIFLGDNIYPNGLPNIGEKDRNEAENKLDLQINIAKNFKGKTIFIPGNHDYYHGNDGVKNQENYINEKLGAKKSFLPKNACGVDDYEINEHLAVIVINSQWFLEDWDKLNDINDKCSIKNREDFFEEIESLINKFQNKTTLIAIHHPLMSHGTHGGQFSLEKQLFPLENKIPLPFLATAINYLRKTSGISPQDIQNKQYTKLINRLKTLIQNKENVVVVSGHDHNLQYIEKDNIKQIISGSGSKTEAARAIYQNDFSYGGNGYAVLETQNNGSAQVKFYGISEKDETLLFQKKILEGQLSNQFTLSKFPTETTISAQIYDQSLTQKSSFYNFLFGKKYRKYYDKPVNAPIANLSTLYGGLTPMRAGGGHQSKSLRVEDSLKRQFVVRALKKSAVRFVQSVAFKEQFVENDFKNTYAEKFILDFYTSSHPYFPFIVGELADPLGINHSNPKLFYLPKQKSLGEFNQNFGDELYMIEERPSSEFTDLESFGKPNDIISTVDVLSNIAKDEKYQIDEKAYIKARLFDMLIGDWDRHADQWRWAEHHIGNQIIYRPIPRDRDQAFTIYNGKLLSILMTMPAMRHMQGFKKEIRNVKWFNMAAYPMDLAFLKKSNEQDWIEQAQFIQNNLTKEAIKAAFAKLPQEFQDQTVEEVKNLLEVRKEKLTAYATSYYKTLSKTVVLAGTNKKDKFIIERLPKGATKIVVIRDKKSGEEIQFEKIYHKNETKEIWIYGLQDDDTFLVKGKGSNPIKLRIMGGLDKDLYKLENQKKVKVYDFASQENVFEVKNNSKIKLRDNYELNTYDYKKPKFNHLTSFPSIGFNPDDGVKIGMSTTYTVNDFKRNPFSQKHNIKLNYYFATSGYEILYKGIFPNIVNKWSFQLDAGLTSANFSANFFGVGNESQDLSDQLGMDFNRVKTKKIHVNPSYNWKGTSGAYFSVNSKFDAIKVAETPERILEQSTDINHSIFKTQYYTGLSAKFGFSNLNKEALPTLGFTFLAEGGTEFNIEKTHLQVPFLASQIGFVNQLDHRGKIVFSTNASAKMLFSNDFEFYQMATIGGDQSLRGFRNERFHGKQFFFQTTDVRFELGKIKNFIAPLKYGVLGGFDYGRVWLTHENSNKWHNSYGGGIWLSGIDVVTAKISYFTSKDGGRITFGFAMGF